MTNTFSSSLMFGFVLNHCSSLLRTLCEIAEKYFLDGFWSSSPPNLSKIILVNVENATDISLFSEFNWFLTLFSVIHISEMWKMVLI